MNKLSLHSRDSIKSESKLKAKGAELNEKLDGSYTEANSYLNETDRSLNDKRVSFVKMSAFRKRPTETRGKTNANTSSLKCGKKPEYLVHVRKGSEAGVADATGRTRNYRKRAGDKGDKA